VELWGLEEQLKAKLSAAAGSIVTEGLSTSGSSAAEFAAIKSSGSQLQADLPALKQKVDDQLAVVIDLRRSLTEPPDRSLELAQARQEEAQLKSRIKWRRRARRNSRIWLAVWRKTSKTLSGMTTLKPFTNFSVNT
jgi:hypothetical protein